MPQRRPFQNCIAQIMMNKDYKLKTCAFLKIELFLAFHYFILILFSGFI
jgi:hypothetical protein